MKKIKDRALTAMGGWHKEKTKGGLPPQAFAIVGDPQDPETWKLPHHTKLAPKTAGDWPPLDIEFEYTVDWDLMPAAVASLSRAGYQGQRVLASPDDIISAARHLAHHHQAAGKSVPDTLGALI